MSTISYCCLASLAMLVATPSVALKAADRWPELRGPNGTGHAAAAGVPVKWRETENVRWKTAVHDRGWSSPVVWDDQVWVTTASEDGTRLFAVALDRRSGRILHDIKVFDVEKPEHIAAMNSYASPTPAIEAGRIYVHFGTYGTACLDTSSGKVLWSRRDLNCDHHEGPGASITLVGDLLIVPVDGCDVQYLAALDKSTGKTIWKTPRSVDYGKIHRFTRKAFCTPVVVEADGTRELVSPCSRAIIAYDLLTGAERWKFRHRGWSMVPRPQYAAGLIFAVIDYDRPELLAIRPGRGELTDDAIVWRLERGAPQKATPVVVGELLYFVSDRGVAACVEAATGKMVWQQRLGGDYAASPLLADGRLYFVNDEGLTTVIEPGRECKTVATNQLDGRVMASPAAAGKAFFIRTETHLYCLESSP